MPVVVVAADGEAEAEAEEELQLRGGGGGGGGEIQQPVLLPACLFEPRRSLNPHPERAVASFSLCRVFPQHGETARERAFGA